MAGLIKNVNKVKSVFGDIKTAIQSRGVNVDDNTPVSEYAGLINNIPISGIVTTDWAYMFYKNYRYDLLDGNTLDSSGVKNFTYFAYDSTKLKVIKDIDTSSATSTQYMFSGCKNIEEFPSYFNLTSLSATTNSGYNMFAHIGNNNEKLRDKSMFVDLPPVCNASFLFGYSPFKSIHITSDTQCTDMSNMFRTCQYLEEVTGLNMSQATSYTYIFESCKALVNLEIVGTIAAKGTYNTTLNLEDSVLLTHESLMRVVNALEVITKDNYLAKLVLGETNLAKLTDEEKAIVTDKGWTLT